MHTLLTYSQELADALAKIPEDMLTSAFEAIIGSIDAGKKLFICGNGGSASTGSHMACDFQKWAHVLPEDAPQVAAICLSDNTAIMTAIANDVGFDQIFASQISALGTPGDLLLVISVSGNSPNVLKALSMADSLGISTLALTGMDGGVACSLADMSLTILSDDYGIVEDAHAVIMHVLTRMIREHYTANGQ